MGKLGRIAFKPMRSVLSHEYDRELSDHFQELLAFAKLMNLSSSIPLTVPVETISRCDRWLACQRLQDLSIPCQCQLDGCLQVEITHPIAILQLRSVVQQITASRSELIEWLERCLDCDI